MLHCQKKYLAKFCLCVLFLQNEEISWMQEIKQQKAHLRDGLTWNYNMVMKKKPISDHVKNLIRFIFKSMAETTL